MMKKTMFALALLGASCGSASAQSSVAVYGVVDMGIVHEGRGGTAGSVTRLDSGNLHGSRVGFGGVEDLGGGLSALFQLENGFNADDGTLGQGGTLFGRQAFVGLNGSFGSVKLGRQPTIVWMVADVFDRFGDTLAGDSARLFNYSGFRTNNVITYSYGANGFRGYSKGPIDLVLTHHRTNDATGDVAGNTTLVGGNYDSGMLKAFLLTSGTRM